MRHSAVTLEDLLADYEAAAARWKNFFEANPGAAMVSTDIASSKNVGELMWHIYAASFRTAQRLLGEEVSNVESLSAVRNISTAFALHIQGVGKLRRFLETASEATLEEAFEIRSPGAGKPLVSGTKRKLCLHVMVHAIRHWAQIVPLLRVNGFPPDWPQDILFSVAIR
jgi:uncharacterized damage-inducible protein DinB